MLRKKLKKIRNANPKLLFHLSIIQRDSNTVSSWGNETVHCGFDFSIPDK